MNIQRVKSVFLKESLCLGFCCFQESRGDLRFLHFPSIYYIVKGQKKRRKGASGADRLFAVCQENVEDARNRRTERMSEKREDYITWDEYFMGVASLSGKRSKDPSTQVGACIVSQDNKILSMGYNGFPRAAQMMNFPGERSMRQTIPIMQNTFIPPIVSLTPF